MAGTRWQVRTYGADKVAQHLQNLGRRAEDLRPAWPGVARRAAVGYRRSFERNGPGWAPLKPETVRRRISEGMPPGMILRRTYSYYDAATNPNRLILAEAPDGVEIAVDDEVTAYHQSGSSRMPARPLKLSFGDRMLIVSEIDKTLHAGYWSA